MGMKVSRELEAEILRRCAEEPRQSTLPAPTLPLDISEADFQAWVIARATERRWLAYHTYRSRNSKEGFPDLVLARGGEILFVELKTTKGKVSPAQREWLDMLSLHVPCCVHCKIGVYVWRPTDTEDILRILQ